jgi:hypothetical protein
MYITFPDHFQYLTHIAQIVLRYRSIELDVFQRGSWEGISGEAEFGNHDGDPEAALEVVECRAEIDGA